jgi:SAM-dependent methyltransferase
MTTDIARWLNVAADEKAASVIALAPPNVSTVVEIGCGTGALLHALDRQGFADRYWGCEPARNLYDQIPRQQIARLVDVAPTTFDSAFGVETFDLAILSHVLEHLLTPAVLLHEALARARYVLVEVPLEANAAGRARMAVKRASGRDPKMNDAGHVQFFSRNTARLLVRHAGGEVVADHGYFPEAPYREQAVHIYQRAVLASARIGVARHYYEHFAMLTRRADVGEWDHHYARPV